MIQRKYRVPKSGDSVRILSDGTVGQLIIYHQRKQSYEIQMATRRIFLVRQDFELEESAAAASNDDHRMHVLIPSQVERERDLTLLLRGVQSLLAQTDSQVTCFLSVGGPLLHKGADALRALLCHQTAMEWYLMEDDKVQNSFSQLPKLHELSHELNSDAWILFLKQTDMFHPLRIHAFREVLNDPMTDVMPFPLGSKLLLDETKLNNSEGKLQDYINSQNDFDKWKSHPQARKSVVLAPSNKLEEMDAQDYSDFCVPSALLRRFLYITPQGLLRNEHCELRLLSMLDDMADLEPLTQYPWLLVAYQQTKKKRFLPSYNRHDWLSGNKILDDPSVVVPLTDFDSRTSKHQITPTQVALVRIHMDAILVKYSIWNDLALDDSMIKTIREVDLVHGRGFGKMVWQHCEERVRSRFSKEELQWNREWSDGAEFTIEASNSRRRSIDADDEAATLSVLDRMCCGCIRSLMG